MWVLATKATNVGMGTCGYLLTKAMSMGMCGYLLLKRRVWGWICEGTYYLNNKNGYDWILTTKAMSICGYLLLLR